MTGTTSARAARLTDRWPTALAVVPVAGALTVMARSDQEARIFGPAIATMAGIYLVAYAIGRPWTAWLAFVALSAVVSVFPVLRALAVPGADAAVGMTVLLVPLWLWAVARRRFTDRATFSVQTAGLIGFGTLTLLCAAVAPRLGILVAAVGFLAHAAWDAYHFAVDRVVNRSWSEFCAVVDVVVGVALVVVAAN
ncbi:hypothetical protein ACI2K4_09130 [Micromonospora sp. NPDC050397]|uniref:hypothetical protein n=1 Tax=Micromonospora sp. NPDC050397 TaxID=3364279 RepID=UPI00384D041F